MNYTKGDWEQVFDGMMYYVDVVGRKRNDSPIANCYHNKANAHLMAAAPDMYEALKGALWVMQGGRCDCVEKDITTPFAIKQVEKALAKAEEAQ